MKITVVTGNNAEGFRDYGLDTLEAFEHYWDPTINLIIYSERPTWAARGINRLLKDVPELQRFQTKHACDEYAKGRRKDDAWKNKEIRDGYSYRFDIMKFSKQVMYLYDAALKLSSEEQYLIWLDNDVMTLRGIAPEFLTSLLPEKNICSYLGRVGKHSEIGFLIFKMPEAFPLIYEYAKPVLRDTVFSEKEWHSAFLFDLARDRSNLPCHNMTPTGRGHVWFQSKLGDYMDHMKGKRKIKMGSVERR